MSKGQFQHTLEVVNEDLEKQFSDYGDLISATRVPTDMPEVNTCWLGQSFYRLILPQKTCSRSNSSDDNTSGSTISSSLWCEARYLTTLERFLLIFIGYLYHSHCGLNPPLHCHFKAQIQPQPWVTALGECIVTTSGTESWPDVPRWWTAKAMPLFCTHHVSFKLRLWKYPSGLLQTHQVAASVVYPTSDLRMTEWCSCWSKLVLFQHIL